MPADTIDHHRQLHVRVVAAATAATLVVSGPAPVVASVARTRHARPVVVAVASAPVAPVDDALRVGRASRSTARAPIVAMPTPPPPSRDQLIETVVAWALSQRGLPYVYGAAGPYAYDCSGLTMRAYERIGVELGHWTGFQLQHGTPVDRAHLRRGDLVFPLWDHVAIYLGDGRMIVAPTEGEVVRIEPVWGFYAGRRILP